MQRFFPLPAGPRYKRWQDHPGQQG